jgi:hypothetical protein
MSDNNPVMVTPEIGVINDSGEDLNIVQVLTAGREQNPQFAELLPEREFAEIVKWTTNTQGGSGRLRRGSIFDRDRCLTRCAWRKRL